MGASKDIFATGLYKSYVLRWFCYYTEGDVPGREDYGVAARRCISQFASFGMEVIPVVIPQAGDWMLTILQRAIDLARKGTEHSSDFVGLLDADLIVRSKPVTLMEPFKGDILVNDYGGNVPYGRRFSAGCVSFAPTPKGRELLQYWANECVEDKMKHMGLREQYYLYRAIEQLRPEVNALDLMNYNRACQKGEEKRFPDGVQGIVIHV